MVFLHSGAPVSRRRARIMAYLVTRCRQDPAAFARFADDRTDPHAADRAALAALQAEMTACGLYAEVPREADKLADRLYVLRGLIGEAKRRASLCDGDRRF